MVKVEKEDNSKFLEKSISHLKARGFKDIKADLKGYDSPKSYMRKASGTVITPDISATKDGRKYFFDISLKSDKPRLLKSKWVFLDTLSRMKSNRFRIITTRGHYKFTDSMLQDINLSNKTPIKI